MNAVDVILQLVLVAEAAIAGGAFDVSVYV